MAHTPGPWTVSIDHDGDGYATGYARVLTPEYQNPAKGWCSDYFPVEDAHLIAAAPDLLAGCKALLLFFEGGNCTWADAEAARQAIAKAEGR